MPDISGFYKIIKLSVIIKLDVKIQYTNPIEHNKKDPKGSFWLGRKDSNLRMAGPKPAALPLGDAPLSATFIILLRKT